MDVSGFVLLPGEAEAYVRDLEKFSLKEIGSRRWYIQHGYIEKLNMQAILCAKGTHHDFVMEELVLQRKIPTLIHSLALVEIWKQKVFPILCKLQDFKPKFTFPLYMVIHHEGTIINLLETIMFYQEPCEAMDDSLLDLLDYCHRKLSFLACHSAASNRETPPEDRLTSTTEEGFSLLDLQEKNDAKEFEISLKALTVLRYITDHLDRVNPSVINRLLCTHNIPCVLVQLLEHCPWSRSSAGKNEKYMDGSWQQISLEDQMKMTKIDGQVWIALHNILLRPECQEKYDFNSFNKGQILKLRGFLKDVLIDQMPNLSQLLWFLNELSVKEPVPPKKGLILEQIPEIWTSIMNKNMGKWKSIAKYQMQHVFNHSEDALRQEAHRLAEIYNLDVMESLVPDKPKCGSCGCEASKRCSRCQNEWYCCRACQVKHWPKHKNICQIITEATIKLQEELKVSA